MPPTLSQKLRRIANQIANQKPVTQKQIANIERQMRNGTHGLPDLGPGYVWGLVDSGSAPHVAPHSKIFPGATLEKSHGDGFVAANGSAIDNLGKFKIDVQTQEGHDRTIEFNNANVSFPMLSTGRSADNDN